MKNEFDDKYITNEVKKYIDNICPVQPLGYFKKIKKYFYISMEKVGEGYGGERNLW